MGQIGVTCVGESVELVLGFKQYLVDGDLGCIFAGGCGSDATDLWSLGGVDCFLELVSVGELGRNSCGVIRG